MTDAPPARPLDAKGASAASLAIRLAVQEGRIDEAVAAARDLAPEAAQFPRLAHMALLALARGGDAATAARLVDDVVKQGKCIPALATLAVQHLVDTNRPGEAYAFALLCLADEAEPDVRLSVAATRAAVADHRESREALAHLDRVRERAGDDLLFLREAGELQLTLGRYDDARDMLRRAVEKVPDAVNVRLLYVRALRYGNRPAEACDEMMEVVRRDPSMANRRYAVALLLQVGREDEAKSLYDIMVGERAARLKPTLAEQIASLDARVDEIRIPQRRLDWAWDIVSRKLGHPPSTDRAEWDRRAKWGHLLDLTLLDWLECSFDRAGEISDLFQFSEDEEAREILAAADEGKGVLLVSAHIGVMFAGPVAIDLLERPYRWLSSTPRISSTRYADTLISTADLNEIQVARNIVKSLQQGCLVTLAADGVMSPNTPRITWEGVPVTYSPFCAVLAHRCGIPTVFTAPYWADGRFRFAVKRMPSPEKDETLSVFTERWRQAFFDEVVEHLARGPENLRLNGGIWRYV